MLKRSRIFAIAAASAMLTVLAPAAARADTNSDLKRLVVLNPGVDSASMESSVRQYAASQGVAYESALTSVLREAELSAANSGAARSSGGVQIAAADVIIGTGQNKGDVFWAPAMSYGVPHGHSGIYYTPATIVEAPGLGKISRSVAASSLHVGSGSQKQRVETSAYKRNASATYAYNNFRNRAYNANFAFNRTADGNMNCSQLVWAAYKVAANIDIDGNGGAGVHPWDIRDSSLTTTYSTV